MKVNSIKLADGRVLAFAEVGNPDGKPFFYFHGFPACRLEAMLAEPVAKKLGVRIIAPDRPGIGRSCYMPGRRITDWPDDVAHLADALGIERFAVCGVSGGGPYSAACAWKIPHRLSAAGIVCGVGPPEIPHATDILIPPYKHSLRLAKTAPWLVKSFFSLTRPLFRQYPKMLLTTMAMGLPGPDRELLNNHALGRTLFASVSEAFYSGSQGPVHDLLLYVKPWGFSLKDIPIQILLWQGEMDRCVAPDCARHMEKHLPLCQASYSRNDGHFSLVVNNMEEIITRLTQ